MSERQPKLSIGMPVYNAERYIVEAFDSLSAGAFVGSLVAVLVLIALPMLLLGTVAPYAVRLAVSRLEEAGAVTGRLYAISTLGSLAGTFLSALLFIPLVGTRRTFLAFALALGVEGDRLLLIPRRWSLLGRRGRSQGPSP